MSHLPQWDTHSNRIRPQTQGSGHLTLWSSTSLNHNWSTQQLSQPDQFHHRRYTQHYMLCPNSPMTVDSHDSSPAVQPLALHELDSAQPPSPPFSLTWPQPCLACTMSYQPAPMSGPQPAFPPAQQQLVNAALSAGQKPISQPLGKPSPQLVQYYPL